MKHPTQGFTLIELVIVVAIIGILSSIAIPAYQTYVAKSILSSLYTSASGGRSGVLSRYMEIGEMPEEGSGLNGITESESITIGLDNALRASTYQSSVTYLKETATKASYQVTLNNVNSNVNGEILTFVFEDVSGAFTLSCIASPRIKTKYRPQHCK